MSALAEALVAAQRRAIGAMEKAYVAGNITDETVDVMLDSIGLTDAVDKERLVQALIIVKSLGAAPPTEPTNGGEPKPPEPASDAQLALIADLVKRKNVPAPDLPLTKVDASAIISSLQAGTYDPSKWSIPF